MAASDYVDEAVAALGGEDSDFIVKGIPGDKHSPYSIGLFCRSHEPGTLMGIYSIGEMELWELVTDAREHYETVHRIDEARDAVAEARAEGHYQPGVSDPANGGA